MVLGADAQSQDKQPAGLPVLAGRAWVLPINKATRGPPARGSGAYGTAACSMRQTGPPVSGGCGARGAVMCPGGARGPTAGPTGGRHDVQGPAVAMLHTKVKKNGGVAFTFGMLVDGA